MQAERIAMPSVAPRPVPYLLRPILPALSSSSAGSPIVRLLTREHDMHVDAGMAMQQQPNGMIQQVCFSLTRPRLCLADQRPRLCLADQLIGKLCIAARAFVTTRLEVWE